MNKRCIFSLLMVVFLLSTFVIGMAVTANAETLAESEVLVDETVLELLSNPLTWIFGALYLFVMAILEFFGSIISAIVSVIGLVIGIILAIINGVKALF